MKPLRAALALIFFVTSPAHALPAPELNSLAALQFLEGKWIGEGSSEVGKGSGFATFEQDLQGKVLVRRNHAEYPAAEGRPAYQHDDLMVIYSDAATKGMRAFYTDNEGHVIHYTVSLSPDGNTLTFLGDAALGAPRYRLTYTRISADRMSIVLESQAAEGAAFQKIVEGKIVKTTGTATKP